MTPPPGTVLPRIRILVVEENERLLHALLQFLATEPAVEVVGSAESPDEAVIQAARFEPELGAHRLEPASARRRADLLAQPAPVDTAKDRRAS